MRLVVDLGVLGAKGVGVVMVAVLDGGVHLESVSHLSFCFLQLELIGSMNGPDWLLTFG